MSYFTLSPAQQSIIREICEIEIDALEKLLASKKLDKPHKILLELYHCPVNRAIENLRGFKMNFERVHDDPYYLFSDLPDEEISIFRHVFFTIYERLYDDRPKAVVNLYRNLCTLEYTREIMNLMKPR